MLTRPQILRIADTLSGDGYYTQARNLRMLADDIDELQETLNGYVTVARYSQQRLDELYSHRKELLRAAREVLSERAQSSDTEAKQILRAVVEGIITNAIGGE